MSTSRVWVTNGSLYFILFVKYLFQIVITRLAWSQVTYVTIKSEPLAVIVPSMTSLQLVYHYWITMATDGFRPQMIQILGCRSLWIMYITLLLWQHRDVEMKTFGWRAIRYRIPKDQQHGLITCRDQTKGFVICNASLHVDDVRLGFKSDFGMNLQLKYTHQKLFLSKF